MFSFSISKKYRKTRVIKKIKLNAKIIQRFFAFRSAGKVLNFL